MPTFAKNVLVVKFRRLKRRCVNLCKTLGWSKQRLS